MTWHCLLGLVALVMRLVGGRGSQTRVEGSGEWVIIVKPEKNKKKTAKPTYNDLYMRSGLAKGQLGENGCW